MDINYIVIGKKIKNARLDKGLTQEQLSELTAISLSHISNIETAKTKVSLPALISICNVLDISVDDALDENIINYETQFTKEIFRLCKNCDSNQKRLIINVVEAIVKTKGV